MSTERYSMEVGGIRVEVLRKEIRNLHLGVYPPTGRVRVAAPLRMDDEAIRLAVVSRLSWIRRQQARFEAQSRYSPREMVTGESHWVWGRRYRLRVMESDGACGVTLDRRGWLLLRIRPGMGIRERLKLLDGWYRELLRDRIPPLLDKWQARTGLEVREWRIRKMKTRWGSCNAEARRIWLNLELAKRPHRCLEYVLVHEMLHFIERHHNERFLGMLDGLMPSWCEVREELNEILPQLPGGTPPH